MQNEKLTWLLQALGYQEEPLGVYYTDVKPELGHGPEAEPGKGHDCMLKYVRLARTKKVPGWVSKQKFGCFGGALYAGFMPPSDRIANFVTTGLPGVEGEHYMPNPESMWRFFKEIDVQSALANYCVFKPLSQFRGEEKPEVILFFARGELLTGLCQLACFSLNDHNAVVFPFGSGCANLLAWPLHYSRQAQLNAAPDKAVLGGADPSCRPYLETDELSFAVSAQSFQTMLDAAPNSFLSGHTWATVQKKIRKSQKMWAR